MWLLTLVLFADTAHAFSVVLTPVESVQVTVTGAGEPVVLIPGLFGSAFGFRRAARRWDFGAAGARRLLAHRAG